MGNRSKQNFQKKELKWPRNRKWSLSWCHQGNANLNYFEVHLISIKMPRTITTSSYKFDFIHFLGHDKELWIRCDSLFYYRISSIYFLTQLNPVKVVQPCVIWEWHREGGVQTTYNCLLSHDTNTIPKPKVAQCHFRTTQCSHTACMLPPFILDPALIGCAQYIVNVI